ncbi:MAG: WD40 repeat domain-containing protein, partial [Candidatus Acidiferrales bacterium]
VDQALIGFYENAVQAVVAHTHISLRRLRAWFNTALTTPARTRGLVYRGEAQTAGLDNTAVDMLNNAYIIRADNRGYDTWYELAHDRLVEPILAANAAWQATYRNPLAELAQVWQADGHSETHLLTGERLIEAEQYALCNPADLLPEEQEFLADSLRQQAIADKQARQAAQRRRNLAFAALAVIVALSLLTVWALSNAAIARTQEEIANDQRATAEVRRVEAEAAQAEAEEQSRIASSRELAAAAVSNLATDPELSLLLAMYAFSATYTTQAEQALHQALKASRTQHTFDGHAGAVNAVAISPDGQRLVTGGADGAVKLWDTATGEVVTLVNSYTTAVNAVAFS